MEDHIPLPPHSGAAMSSPSAQESTLSPLKLRNPTCFPQHWEGPGTGEAHMLKPALVNHGTDARRGFSEEAGAVETQAAALKASWVPSLFLKPG